MFRWERSDRGQVVLPVGVGNAPPSLAGMPPSVGETEQEEKPLRTTRTVTPAKAGVHAESSPPLALSAWMPALAGMTRRSQPRRQLTARTRSIQQFSYFQLRRLPSATHSTVCEMR